MPRYSIPNAVVLNQISDYLTAIEDARSLSRPDVQSLRAKLTNAERVGDGFPVILSLSSGAATVLEECIERLEEEDEDLGDRLGVETL